MNQIILLRQALKPLLGWHGARLNFLALFLIALLRVKTINLAELATGFRSNAKTESNAGLLPHRLLRRLERIRVRRGRRRFFRSFDLDYVVVAKAIIALMEIPQPWVLSTDRTEWSFNKKRFNILMLGVLHFGHCLSCRLANA